jgi:hypothetical protein
MKESKNGGILCTHEWKWKMRCTETIPGMEGGRIKESDGGVNLTVIYGKNVCKCHNGAPVQQSKLKLLCVCLSLYIYICNRLQQ